MNTNSINKWLTLGANLGVLVGIVLLAYEIHQVTVTTRAEMISDFQDRWVAIDLSWQNEDLAAAWAKAMENPEDLTLTEMVQLNGFMWSYIDHIGTNRLLWQLGVFEEPLNSEEEIIVATSHIFFGNRFARAWWAENKAQVSSSTAALIDREIDKVTPDERLDLYDRIKNRMRE